jgi:RsiW-degrading membrane proteinase PrsW (M82 family)
MMVLNYIVSLTLAPLIAAIIIAIVWVKRDKYRYPQMISSFILGMISILVVLLFMNIADRYYLNAFRNLRRIIFYSFVVMGLGSELGKFIILRYHNFNKNSFNGPLDGIVYSVMISMGFAFSSNILYFTLPYYTDIDFLYAVTVVFSNLFFAVILGFFVGLAKIRENKFVDTMTGLLAASFFHALYNFCFITEDLRLLLFYGIGAFIVVIMLYYKAYEMNADHKRIKKE